jgi:hypothetical protein
MIRRGGLAALVAMLVAACVNGATGQAAVAGSGAGIAAGDLTVSVSQSKVSALTGDSFNFTSEIKNAGFEATPPLIANLAFVAVDGGTYVDPEDWSAERTQAVEPIAAGATSTQMWTVKTVLEGDVAAYVAVLPAPPALATDSPLAVSPAIQMHVEEHRALNPGGVLPTVLVVPVVLLAAFGGMRIVRRLV